MASSTGTSNVDAPAVIPAALAGVEKQLR